MTRNIAFRGLYPMLFLAISIAMAEPQDRLRVRLEGGGTAPVHGTRSPHIGRCERCKRRCNENRPKLSSAAALYSVR
jgi:hypothetical protein